MAFNLSSVEYIRALVARALEASSHRVDDLRRRRLKQLQAAHEKVQRELGNLTVALVKAYSGNADEVAALRLRQTRALQEGLRLKEDIEKLAALLGDGE